MMEQLQKENIKLFSLEGKQSLGLFDVLGFTLQYELSYTNILAMLELSGVPLFSCERDESHPLVVGGGPCACNPEPVADFFDAIVLGEGEEVTVLLCGEVNRVKKE